MASFFTGPWPFWLAAALLAVSALPLFLWAGFLDRPRGRKRCPKCWYDLSAVNTLTCSECGHTARSARKLHKTRRHKRWIALALLLILASTALAFTPKVRRDGLASITPTTILIAGLEWWPNPADFRANFGRWNQKLIFYDELQRRAQSDSLWDWQWNWLINKCVNGDDNRPVPFTEWNWHYGNFLRYAVDNGILDPSDSKYAHIQHSIHLRTRDSWPVDTPLYVAFRASPVFDLMNVFGARAKLIATQGDEATYRIWPGARYASKMESYRDSTRCVGTPDAGVSSVTFEITVDASPEYVQQVTIPLRAKGPIDQHVTPVEHAGVENSIAQIHRPLFRRQFGDLVIPVGKFGDSLNLLENCTLAIRLEVLYDDLVVAVADAWWDSAPRARSFGVRGPNQQTIFIFDLDWIIPEFRIGHWSDDHWQLRITGDPEVALRNFDCDRYWAGSVTIPLIVE